MASRKKSQKKSRKRYQPQTGFQKFMEDEPIKVGRDILWGGHCGTVVGFADGLHRVLLDTKPDGSKCSPFHADVHGDDLETHL